VFSVGLRGTDPDSVEAIEQLVVDTLRELAADGIASEMIEAAVHRVEFRNREIRRGGRPYSLTLMRRALRGWLHGSPPEATLEFRPPMDALKRRLREGRYLEELVIRYFLDNPHRSTVLVRPDLEQAEREAREERGRLTELLETMSEAERSEVRQAEQRLRDFQDRDDSGEARSRVPTLHIDDLKREVELIPSAKVLPQLPVPVLHHDLFTNGVLYVDLAFDTDGLPPGFVELVPLLGKATSSTGLPGVPYHTVAGRLSLLTGGFGSVLSVDSAVAAGQGVCQQLIFRAKFLEEKLPEALALVGSLVKEADFRDLDRLGKIVLEMRNDMKGSLIPGGNFFASLRAGSRFAPAMAIEERWKGISQYLMLSGLAVDLEDRLEELAAALEALRTTLLSRRRLTVNLTCPESSLPAIGGELEKLLATVPEDRPAPAVKLPIVVPASPSTHARAESLVSSMNVSYVAVSAPASAFGTPENAHESLLAHFLTTGYLWEKVRMKGGAYGAGASASGLEKVFGFSSYRDPKIRETLESFRDALRFAVEAPLSEEEFEQILIGAAGREDRPMAPGEKGFVSLKRELLGISDESRQKRRDALIASRTVDIRAAARRILENMVRAYTVVLTGPRALESEAEGLDELTRNRLELPE
jgi:Zn-dependent M16 (insulinase) family peptidase